MRVRDFLKFALAIGIFALGTQSFAFNALDGSTAPVACNQGPFPSGGHQGILVGGVADVNTLKSWVDRLAA